MIIKIYNVSRIILLILFSIISIYASKFYEGSLSIFGIYCASFMALFFFINRKSSYFEIFFFSYLFLGFWFKYIFSLILYNGIVFDSGHYNSSSIDNILLIGILVSVICIVSSIISKKIINIEVPKNNNIKVKSFFQIIYLKNRVLILLLFIILIITASFLNYKFGIYQKGLINVTRSSNLIDNLIKWLLLFGLTTFSCFIIHTEILYRKKIDFSTIFTSLFEIFISFSSMLSRLSPINALSIILPTYQQSLKLKKKNHQKFFIIIIFTLFFSALSIYAVNYLRLYKLNIHQISFENNNQQSFNKLNSALQFNIESNKSIISENKIKSNDVTYFIFINRWVGIDSLILVNNSKKLNFSLLYEALKENKKLNTDNTFYETTFGIKKENFQTDNVIIKGNTLPGIISFLYYSGNLYFVLISLFLIIILFNLLENFIKKITGFNLIFACFLSNTIATRLINFGYAPKESYLFAISIILSVVVMLCLSRMTGLFFSKKKKIYN